MYSVVGYTPSALASAGAAVAATLQFFAASQCLLSEPWPPNRLRPINESFFDFVIVGGGTAGAALAARLAQTNATVLLLEAGGNPPQESIIPGIKDSLKGSPYDWNFTTTNNHVTSQSLIGGVQRIPSGKMLGGSSSLDDMVYDRGFPADYQEWASIIGDLWDWPPVLEAFKKTERLTDEIILKNPELVKYHGLLGEIEVSGDNKNTFTTDRFVDAFRELGYTVVDDMTNPEIVGVGTFSHTVHNGRRDGPVPGLLNKEGWRSNLYVVRNAYATKLLISSKIAYGVEVLIDNYLYRYYSKKEVIVTAGTFNTAKLLLLSGVGPKEHLHELGIPVEADLPVGDNLHDHVMVLTYLAAEDGTCNNNGQMYYDIIQYMYNQTGSLSYSSSMAAYVTLEGSPPNLPDFAIYPVCMSIKSGFYDSCMGVLGIKEEICSILDKTNQGHELLSLAVVLLKPESRGTVRLNSRDPFDDLIIDPGTFRNRADLVNYPHAMKVAYSMADTSYFRGKNAFVVDLNIEECRDVVDIDEQLECRARAMAMSSWQPVGVAALGSVVDERLRVRGIAGLRAAGMSVVPKIIRGNTKAAVVMIAERAAEFIKQDHRLI